MNFTTSGYVKVLESALKQNYKFCSFEDINNFQKSEKICLLRHDIDVSLELAYQMALVEKELEIKSTYFLMLRSPVYNLFARHNQSFVEKIIDMGHHIALHYDEAFYPKHQKKLEDLVQTEAQVIETMFGIDSVKTISFHQPSKAIIDNEIKLINYINTYDKQMFKDFHYISDSNKVWKNYHPQTIFEQSLYPKVHLLIHPIWWISDEDLPTEQLWQKTIKINLHLSEKQIIETERAYGSISYYL